MNHLIWHRMDFKKGIQATDTSLLDLLERYPSSNFTLGRFLEAVSMMRVRQYIISSSPLKDPTKCSLTYTVLSVASRPKATGGRFLGVASNYLQQCEPGDRIHVAVRPSNSGFHPPLSDNIPIIMICAGTDLAPFRAFVQEHSLKIEAGAKSAPTLLFYALSAPDQDDMYVQHRLWHDREDAKKLFEQDARIYMCGAGSVGAIINETISQIYIEQNGVDKDEAAA